MNFSRYLSPLRLAVAAFALAAVPVASHAADLLTPEPAPVAVAAAPAWSFSATPYFWMAGLSGDVGVFGAPPVEVDLSFKDALDGLNFSFMGATQARYGRYSFTTDLFVIKTTVGATPRPNRLFTKADLSSTLIEATALGGYAIIDQDRFRLDLVAGPRIWYVKDKLKLRGGLLNNRSITDDATWIDAMGGARARADLTPNIYLTGTGLVGGGSSKFGWDVTGAIGYEFNDRFSALAGYRAMGVNYESGSFEFDTTLQGPIIGLEIKF